MQSVPELLLYNPRHLQMSLTQTPPCHVFFFSLIPLHHQEDLLNEVECSCPSALVEVAGV